MKKIPSILVLLILSLNFSIAEDKKIKTRGKSDDKQFKKVEINISPDLLDLEELKKLKNNFNYGGPARTRTWDQYIMSVLL